MCLVILIQLQYTLTYAAWSRTSAHYEETFPKALNDSLEYSTVCVQHAGWPLPVPGYWAKLALIRC